MPDTILPSQNQAFEETRDFLRKHGYPAGDVWERPTSDARFPDGAHFRIEVPTVNSADGRSLRNLAMSLSLRPSPYTSAVSKNVMPSSRAVLRAAMASSSVTSPQSAPIAQAPKPIRDIAKPVLPSRPYSIASFRTARPQATATCR